MEGFQDAGCDARHLHDLTARGNLVSLFCCFPPSPGIGGTWRGRLSQGRLREMAGCIRPPPRLQPTMAGLDLSRR